MMLNKKVTQLNNNSTIGCLDCKGLTGCMCATLLSNLLVHDKWEWEERRAARDGGVTLLAHSPCFSHHPSGLSGHDDDPTRRPRASPCVSVLAVGHFWWRQQNSFRAEKQALRAIPVGGATSA